MTRMYGTCSPGFVPSAFRAPTQTDRALMSSCCSFSSANVPPRGEEVMGETISGHPSSAAAPYLET